MPCWCCLCTVLTWLQVTLWNTGEDAYQHHTYGDWLTIERVIKDKGGTQYKILNSAGKKVGLLSCVCCITTHVLHGGRRVRHLVHSMLASCLWPVTAWLPDASSSSCVLLHLYRRPVHVTPSALLCHLLCSCCCCCLHTSSDC